MNLLDSLLDAIIRLDGDALVIHVGEKPYVVTTSEATNEFRGPLAWGQVELSSRILTPEAVGAMLGQILPLDQRAALDEYGATEYEVTASTNSAERFTIVAARGGDDIWLEVRRRAKQIPIPAAVPSAAKEAPQESAEAVSAAATEPRTEAISMDHTESPAADQPDETPAAAIHGDDGEADQPDEFVLSAEQDLMPADGEWTDDVMTEGELGELLRASAAAVITGDVPDESDLEPVLAFDEPEDCNVEEEPVDDVAAEADVPVPAPAMSDRDALLAEQEALWAAAHAAAAVRAEPVTVDLDEQTETVDSVTYERDDDRVEEGAEVHATASAGEAELAAGAEAPEAVEEAVEEAGEEALEEEPSRSRPAGIVVPLSRPVRPDSVAGEVRSGAPTLERVLRLGGARGAATVYLVAQSPPMARIDGEFSALDGEPVLTAAVIERLTAEIAPRGTDTASPDASDWMLDVADIGRVRCMSFRDHRGPGLILRLVPARAVSADHLGLPAEVQSLCSEADGLVLVAGGRGSGKSTLLTSFVDLINRTRSDHVITTEAQIEFVHENKRSFISQREVRGDADAVAAVVRAALREDPDVLIVEELRTPELVSLALEAAESGRLVFGSVPAVSAVSAIERVLEMFPPERREKTQASFASALRGVVSQILLRKVRGGRVAAREVLLNTPAVANLILEGKTFQLPAALESGRRFGMTTFAESLAALVREGTVHPSHAYRKAPNREQFLALLRREGVDPSVAERLA